MKERVSNFYLVENVVWLLLITLDSFYFYNLGMPVFSVIGVFYTLKFFVFNNVPVIKESMSTVSILIGITIISLFTAFVNSYYFLEKRFLLLILIIPVIFYVSFLLTYRLSFFIRIIKIVLKIHVVFLILQIVYFYGLGGQFLDYLEPITGESQRALGGNYSVAGMKLIRSTGLFNEPGTYSTFVFLLYLVYNTLKRSVIGFYTLKLFDIVVICSVLFTFSLFGFLFVSIFMINYLRSVSLKYSVFILVLFSPIIYFILDIYVFTRFSLGSDEAGTGFREYILEFYLNNINNNILNFLFGYSMFVDFNKLFNVRFIFKDLGFWFTILVSVGIVPILTFMLLFRKNIQNFFLIFVITMLCKLDISTFFLWIVITVFTNDFYLKTNEK